jgi:hypothetical protein
MDSSMGISFARALGLSYGSRGTTWEGASSRVTDNEETTASKVLADLLANQSASDLFGSLLVRRAFWWPFTAMARALLVGRTFG